MRLTLPNWCRKRGMNAIAVSTLVGMPYGLKSGYSRAWYREVQGFELMKDRVKALTFFWAPTEKGKCDYFL